MKPQRSFQFKLITAVTGAFVTGIVGTALFHWLTAGSVQDSPKTGLLSLAEIRGNHARTSSSSAGFLAQDQGGQPEAANCPQGAVVDGHLLTMTCQQDDGSINQGNFNNSLRIVAGNGSFAEISTSEKTIHANANAQLTGVVTLQAHNGFPGGAVAPLIWTTSWGDHDTSWRSINHWIPVGDSTYAVRIDVKAPHTPGTYSIIFAFEGEMNGAEVASASNWAGPGVRWNDCNDLSDFTREQIAEAQKCGFTVDEWLWAKGYGPTYVPADALTIEVGGWGL